MSTPNDDIDRILREFYENLGADLPTDNKTYQVCSSRTRSAIHRLLLEARKDELLKVLRKEMRVSGYDTPKRYIKEQLADLESQLKEIK